MKKGIGIIIITLFIASIMNGCEDQFVKDFDVDTGEFKSKLAVDAVIDINNNSFNVIISSTTPAIGWQISKPIGKGNLKLFENRQLILSIAFDPQNNKNIADSLAEYYLQGDGSLVINRYNIAFSIGNTYRLEIDAEGFENVYAEEKAAKGLVFGPATIDTSTIIEKDFRRIEYLDFNYYYYGGYDPNYNRNSYHPVDINISDSEPEKNYYSLSLVNYPPSTYGSSRLMFITSDRTLLIDHPGLSQTDAAFSDQVISAYAFSNYIASDMFFTDGKVKHSFLINSNDIKSYSYDEAKKLYPNRDIVLKQHTVQLRAKNISEGAYQYFKSIKQQYYSDGPFMEPITIPSNITNGYGYFSIESTTTITLYQYESYGLEDNYIYY
jgi:hypothetical protein